MIGLKQKKVLSVYSGHIASQEAEINHLMSDLKDYRTKFGDLGTSESIVNQKADIEKRLQEVRHENHAVQLQLSALEKDLRESESVFKEMDQALQKLTSQNVTKELSKIQDEVKTLDQNNNNLDSQIKVIEDELNNLLNTKGKM